MFRRVIKEELSVLLANNTQYLTLLSTAPTLTNNEHQIGKQWVGAKTLLIRQNGLLHVFMKWPKKVAFGFPCDPICRTNQVIGITQVRLEIVALAFVALIMRRIEEVL